MITVSHVTKRFGAVAAVQDVSFAIAEGEVVGLLGPNGAGKTTTMRIMTGYYAPDEGEVTIDGVSVESDPRHARRQIGYLPESNPLYKDMLVSEYLIFLARLHDVPRSTYRHVFDRVVADTGIDEVYYRPISELSKGYRQRVGLAGALVSDPPILILDEPTEGLDPNQRNDLRSLLSGLARKKTILVSTHVMAEAQAVAHRVVVLKQGAVVAQGTIEDLTRGTAGTVFTLEVEGTCSTDMLRKLQAVTDVRAVSEEKKRAVYTITTKDADAFAQELSRLLCSKSLVIHGLTQEARGLERAFAELTLGGAAPEAPDTSASTH